MNDTHGESGFAQEIVDFVRARPGTSFVELSQKWPDHFGGGEHAMELENTKVSNIILWQNVTIDAINAINFATKHLHLTMKQTPPVVYVIDGAVPRMPLAKSARHYKEPRWMPVSFSVGGSS